MESTNNQTPARSSEEQLKAKYGGKLYRVGITVPVDDESEKEFSYYFKRPTVPMANAVTQADSRLDNRISNTRSRRILTPMFLAYASPI